MVGFNPNSPAVLGNEWLPIHEVTQILNSPTQALTARLASTITETVDQVWFFATATTGGAAESYAIDIYESGVFPGPLEAITVNPSTTAGVIGTASTWDGSVVGAVDYEDFVQPGSTPVAMPAGFIGSADKEFVYTADGSAYLITFTYDGLATAAAGKHVVKVTTEAKVQAFSTIGDVQAFTARPYLIIDGNPYWGALQTFAGPALGGHSLQAEWFVNPAELRGWLPTDFGGFDSGTNTDACGWFVAATGSTSIINVIYETSMTVVHAGDDVREATGHVTTTQQRAGELAGVPGWFPLEVSQPDGTPGWAKVAGTDYRIALRRQSVEPDGKQLWVQALEGPAGSLDTVNGWQRLDVRYDAGSRLPYREAIVDDGRAWAPVCALEVGSATSLDSQPYTALDLDSAIYAGIDFRQYFTTPGALPVVTFQLLRVLLGRMVPSTLTTGSITLRVRRASDDVQMGSAVTVTADDFDDYTDDPGQQTAYAKYKTVVARMDTAATLAVATRYYFQVESDATEPETGWRVQSFRAIRGLNPDTPPPDVADATFGGSTDSVVVGVTTHDETDASLVVLTRPVEPTDLVAEEAIHADSCIRYVSLSWSATALGGTFDRYEIDRRDSEAGPWVRVATVSSEDAETWDDYESYRGRTAYYRIRAVRADTAVSDWSPAASAVAYSPCCGYVLVSNQLAPDTYVQLPDRGTGTRDIEQLHNVESVQFYQRDYQVVFSELEDRGSKFKRTLVFLDSDTPGMRTFERLQALCNNTDIPYVCVHEESGDRWFASVTLLSTSRTNAGDPGVHRAEIEITEVTNVPTAVVVE